MKVKTLNGNLNIVGKNLRKYRKLKKISREFDTFESLKLM